MPKQSTEKRTAMDFTRIHERAIYQIGTLLPYSAMKVYLYLNFNCNLASGISHRLRYQQIADHWGISLRSVYLAIAQLEAIGVIKMRDAGNFIVEIPHQGLIQHISYAQKQEKKTRLFYQELRKMINAREEKRDEPLPNTGIFHLYEQLQATRRKNRHYYPKKPANKVVLENLEIFAPSADTQTTLEELDNDKLFSME